MAWQLSPTAHAVKRNVHLDKTIYDDEYRALIAALRGARKDAALTQEDVARRLGRPQSWVAKVEGCERRLDVVEFLHLCRALDTDPRRFFDMANPELG